MEREIPWLDSGELVDESDSISNQFFSQHSLAPIEIDGEPANEAPPLATGSRRAMLATLGMLAASGAALAAFFVYTRAIMPAPVELGASIEAPVAPLAALAAAAATAAPAVEPPVTALPEPEPAAAPTEAAQVPAAAPAERVAPKPTATPARPAALRPHRDPALRAAFASLNRGDARDAIARARSILARSPERAEAWLVLGSAYGALHDRHSALQAFRSCSLHGKGPALGSCTQLARD